MNTTQSVRFWIIILGLLFSVFSCIRQPQKVPFEINPSPLGQEIKMANFAVTVPSSGWGAAPERNEIDSPLAEQRLRLNSDDVEFLIRYYPEHSRGSFEKWLKDYRSICSDSDEKRLRLKEYETIVFFSEPKASREKSHPFTTITPFVILIRGEKSVIVVTGSTRKNLEPVWEILETLKFYSSSLRRGN
jgi:hypothetical protein